MLTRLLLAAALFSPTLGAVAHSLETARHEANHPVCSAGSAHLDPASDHEHHDEHGCRLCPRPTQGAAASLPDGQDWASPSFIRTPAPASPETAPAFRVPTRGPPSV